MYTVSKLINRAFRVARVRDYGLPIDSPDLQMGVDYLNLSISDINTDGAEISLNSFFSTSFEVGNSLISVPGFIDIDTLYFILGNSRLPIELMSRDQFYSIATVTKLSAGSPDKPNDGYVGIPFAAYAQRTNDGVDLNIYSSSTTPYRVEINGIKSFDEVGIDDAFTNKVYYSYFIYDVASFLRNHFEMPTDLKIEKMKELQRHKLKMIKPRNTKIKDSCLMSNSNWYQSLSSAGPQSVSQGWKYG